MEVEPGPGMTVQDHKARMRSLDFTGSKLMNYWNMRASMGVCRLSLDCSVG